MKSRFFGLVAARSPLTRRNGWRSGHLQVEQWRKPVWVNVAVNAEAATSFLRSEGRDRSVRAKNRRPAYRGRACRTTSREILEIYFVIESRTRILTRSVGSCLLNNYILFHRLFSLPWREEPDSGFSLDQKSALKKRLRTFVLLHRVSVRKVIIAVFVVFN